MSKPLRVLSYNIHKGFTTGNLGFVLHEIKESIEEVHADLVLLQEVLGHHEQHSRTHSQFEFLADRLWTHYAYGKNAVYTEGHHGNAILSKYPISFWENQDISPNEFERRGILHAVIQAPGMREVHVLCVHLSLFEGYRRDQIEKLCERVSAMVPAGAPLLLGGDFNDWRGRVTSMLADRLGLAEAFLSRTGTHAKTFPSWMPALRLDRIYFRGFECKSAELHGGGHWRNLSDHLPITAEFR